MWGFRPLESGSRSRRTGNVRHLGGKAAVARLAVAEMAPHRRARSGRIAGRDRVVDRHMFALRGLKIGALPFRPMRGHPNALTRNDEAAEIFEEMQELGVAGRRR